METNSKRTFNFSADFLSFLEKHLKKIVILIVLLTSGFLIKEWNQKNKEKEARKDAQIFYIIKKKIQDTEAFLLSEVSQKNKKLKKKKHTFKKNKENLKKHFVSLVLEYKKLLQNNQKTAVFFGASLSLASFLSSYKDFHSSIEVLLPASKKVSKNSLFYPLIFQTLGINYLDIGDYKKAVGAFVNITDQKKDFKFMQPSSLLNLSLAYFKLKNWTSLKKSIARLESKYPKSSETSTAQAMKRYLILNKK